MLSINIAGPDNAIYSTRDSIKGELVIQAQADARFDEVVILFEGTSRTWLEKFGAAPATSGRSTVSHTFLKLVQPIDESYLPIPRIATAGQPISIPFEFVIPDQLLPTTCSHNAENDAVAEAHLHLPPSLNDGSLADGKDDIAPDMTQISYAIHARLVRRRETDNAAIALAKAIRKVHVSPVVEDAPPVIVDEKSPEYRLSKDRQLRKGLLGRTMGRLHLRADQPKPLRFCPKLPNCPGTTSVPLHISFFPKDKSITPPPLESVSAKLKTTTFFSTVPTRYIPTPARSQLDVEVGNYSEMTSLSSRCIGNTQWTLDTDTGAYHASLVVPIQSPKDKHLVPSFSTCYITRTYRLDLAVSVVASSHSHPTISLKLPLQVSQPWSVKDLAESENVDAFFIPRSVAPPPDMSNMQRPAVFLPPGYGSLDTAMIPEPVGISPGCG